MNKSCVYRSVLRASLCFLLLGICSSCLCLKHVVKLPSGPITISGEANDAAGLPLPNIKVRLCRGLRYVEVTTDVKGGYAFTNLTAASYLLRPRLHDCRFLPPSVDLDNLASNTTRNFGGFGPGCGGEPTVNVGAMSGPLTVSGHIRDGSGHPVVGARVDLDDDTRAIRFTDLTGGFAFHVRSEEYKLWASGACSFTPSGKVRKDVRANVVQDFIAGNGCVTASQSYVTSTGSVLTVHQGTTVLGTTYVRVEQLAAPSDGLARLSEIAAEQATTPSRSLTIAGNPAIERQTVVTLPGPGPDIAGSAGPQPGPFTAVTTAIAVGTAVVRFESQLAGDADPATIASFIQVGRNFTPDAIPGLHGPAPTPVPMTRNTPPGPAPVAPGITAAGIVAPGAFGELEVAASDTANVIVYGTQNGPFLSKDGGQTVQASTYNKVAPPPATTFTTKGDPTVAVGAPNASFAQTIYFAQLQQAAPPPPNGKPIVAIGLYQSLDNGSTFNATSFPVNCSVAAAGCVVPDQERLVADRVNRAVTAAGSFDQLYLAWRNFTSQATNAHTIAVACSQDGGANWTVDLTTLAKTGAEFPRLSVGPDGSLIAAYSVTSGATYALQVQKWGSCASGFQPSGSGQVATVTEVTDMPGLDRQATGNYAPAFDDGDGSAQTIFVVYANEASAGNDDIRVAESRDGGKTWTRDSKVNTNGTGRRYFPWLCSTAGKKFVTWYDRRNSTAASLDLTAYYRSSVFDNGSTSSVGIGTELNVSGVDDPQCAPGFPASVRGVVEESQCTNLPAGFIQGGTCRTCAPGVLGPCGTGQACDFRVTPACTVATETCQPGGGGVPKYGDYNGAACALGTLFMAWASATPPTGSACIVAGLPSPSAAQCCSGTRVGGTCAPTAAVCTANGGACGPGLAACCSGSLQCQAGVCLPAIAMYTGSSCLGPGCAGLPVTITYHQTGACNGFHPIGSSAVSVGPNHAYVIFGIERINNSQGITSFAFDPANLFVQQATQHFFDSNLRLYADILGPFAALSSMLAPGVDRKFSVSAQGALVVSTTTADGAVEANQTGYFLRYNRQPSDPPITLVKSDASRTSFPLTRDCFTIALQ